MDTGLSTLLVVIIVSIGLGLAGGYLYARKQRRRSPSNHFETSLGFNYLVSNELDRALEAFSRVAGSDANAVDVRIVLGNLHREKGQTESAIGLHKSLLDRSDLTPRERALVLFCLALDFKRLIRLVVLGDGAPVSGEHNEQNNHHYSQGQTESHSGSSCHGTNRSASLLTTSRKP